MAVYLILMALMLLIAYPLVEHKPTFGKKLCYVIVVFAAMLYISTLRYGLGNDYFSYIYHFNDIRDSSILDSFNLGFEPGFVILNRIIAVFTTDTNLLYVIYAVLILVPIAYVIFRYSENVWLSSVMFVSLTFFYCTLSFIRQAIAFTIILMGYKYFVQRKHFQVLLFIFLACLFHSTVIVLIPLYIIAAVVKPTWISLIVYGVLTGLVYIFSENIIDLAVKVLPQYQGYIDLNFITQGFNPIYIITPLVIMGVALFAHFTSYGKVYPKRSALFTNFAVFSFIIWLLSTKHFVLERFSMYPYIFMIMFIPSIINFYRQRVGAYLYAKKHPDLGTKGFYPDTSVSDPARAAIRTEVVSASTQSSENDEIIAKIMAEPDPAQQAKPAAVPAAAPTDKPAAAPTDTPAAQSPEEKAKALADMISANVSRSVEGLEGENAEAAVTADVSDGEKPADDDKEAAEYDDDYYEYYDDYKKYDEEQVKLLPQNYRYRKKGNAFLDFFRHPVTMYSILLAVVLGVNLWYNYFGLDTSNFIGGSSSSFHGVVPYKSILPAYMRLELSLEPKEDKNTLLRGEEDLLTYLYRITENENYTVVISSRGDPVGGLNSGVRAAANEVGLSGYAQTHSNENYLAVISSGRVIHEEHSTATLTYTENLLGYKTSVTSSRTLSSIKLGSKDFSLNGRGINIVVLDNTTRNIADAVSFKTYYVMLAPVR